ncbi:MAG TPA: hypothetical protein P5277_00450 [Candidatus Paceibacterota bacterium]|nr:hypothetical protein [Candidatus Paceibacterota bacterium]
MRKEVILGLLIIIIITAGAFAETISSEISEEISNYVTSFVEKEGIYENQITGINEVNTESLPKEIEINQIEKNNIGIYEVNFTENNETKNLFIVTYSTNNLDQTSKYIIKNMNIWTFGYPSESSSSDFLYTSAGVKSSETIGYVMMRPGSITGMSTSIETMGGTGSLSIKLYINGKETGFNNDISPLDTKKIDYDIQSEEVISYEAGDIISIYIENSGSVNWKNAVVSIETTS